MKKTKIAASSLLVFLFALAVLYVTADVNYAAVRESYVVSDSAVLDRNSMLLDWVRVNNTRRSLEWVSLNQYPEHFLDMLIRAEDKRYWYHPGVDPLALGSVLSGVVQGHMRGGSTISMQLAGLLDADRSKYSRVTQYFRRMYKAMQLEMRLSKAQILEIYLNKAPLRGEVLGFQTASRLYFDKSVHALSPAESAWLVALLRGPNAELSRVLARATRILPEMKAELTAIASQFDGQIYQLRQRNLLPVLSSNVITEKSGSYTQTSIDYRMQLQVLAAARETLAELKAKNVNDVSVVVLDNQTGLPVVYVANAGRSWSSSHFVDGVSAKRQMGSTLKTFIYARAIEDNLIGAGSWLKDEPIDINVGAGMVYQPRNYDSVFRGDVLAAEALASSLNVPAVSLLTWLGVDQLVDDLKELGFKNIHDADYYGPSLALGTVDASLWELTQAYSRLANTQRRYFSEQTNKYVFSMLSSAEFRRFTFGTNSVLNLNFPAAVKTGTSKDMRDNWCVGYSSRYTVGVWVGNFNGSPMWNISGVSGAAPLWAKVMNIVHRSEVLNDEVLKITPDEKIVHKKLSRFRYPVDRMTFARDPDIPLSNQRLRVEVANPQNGHRIYLNDKLLGKASDELFIQMRPGHYRLKIIAADKLKIDQVEFSVR